LAGRRQPVLALASVEELAQRMEAIGVESLEL